MQSKVAGLADGNTHYPSGNTTITGHQLSHITSPERNNTTKDHRPTMLNVIFQSMVL